MAGYRGDWPLMRWRFVDRVTAFEPWRLAEGVKALSLEEYSLCEPLGRKGVAPESLVLETCVHLLRWLVMRSSDFSQTCLLAQIDAFSFAREVGMGDVLVIFVTVVRQDGGRLAAECRVRCRDQSVARGVLTVELLDLAEALDPELAQATWRELYAAP